MLESLPSMQSENLILASASPRRKMLLTLLGIPFQVVPSSFNEDRQEGEDPLAYVQRLALGKGQEVLRGEDANVLSSDTIVVLDGELLGKPADVTEARSFLERMRGRSHSVFTAVALRKGQEAPRLTYCRSAVPMRDYSEREIAHYLESGDWKDKAGGYAVQHPDFHPCDQVDGCYANVMGLPLCHLANLLDSADMSTPDDLPRRCQDHLDIHCRVYPMIFRQPTGISQ